MSAKRSIARFLMFREQYPDSYAIWHSRIATHGVKNESNCHPFRVGDDGLTYLAHNGMLDVEQPADDRRSDTRVFAEEVLPSMGGVCALDNPTIFNMVSKWAMGSKLAILTLDPRAQRQLYLINEKAGSWDDNHIWWSNTHHRPAKKYEWGGYNYDSGSRGQTLTEVISFQNHATGLWEETKSLAKLFRGWQTGDSYDVTTRSWHTPEPGTPINKIVSHLSVVTTVQETSLDNLESEEDDTEDGIVEITCPQCGQQTLLGDGQDYCIVCDLCFECGTHYLACLCYTPRSTTGGWGHLNDW